MEAEHPTIAGTFVRREPTRHPNVHRILIQTDERSGPDDDGMRAVLVRTSPMVARFARRLRHIRDSCDHVWPAELDDDALCEECGLRYGEWSEPADDPRELFPGVRAPRHEGRQHALEPLPVTPAHLGRCEATYGAHVCYMDADHTDRDTPHVCAVCTQAWLPRSEK